MKDNWTNKLPEHSPKSEAWHKIKDELTFDEWLVQKKGDLPVHEIKELTWDSIQNQLEPEPKESVFTAVYRKKYWLAAASVLVLLMIGWWSVSPEENVDISYSTEVAENTFTTVESTDLKAIDQRCEELIVVCNTLEVKDLRAEIEALANESEALQEQVEVFGDDATILRAQQKVETQKAEMMKQLLELMNHENNS
jgi:hypothetical protein